jgi:hypothetical protein
MKRDELLLRSTAIAIALFAPYICMISQGLAKSYSSYWETPIQPLFILTNAITSYYLFDAERWKAPAFLLLTLTAFSVEMYSTLHNILAVAFFLSCLDPLSHTNHYRWIIIPYVGSVLLVPINLLLAETTAINALVGYHALMLYQMHKISKQKQINNE